MRGASTDTAFRARVESLLSGWGVAPAATADSEPGVSPKAPEAGSTPVKEPETVHSIPLLNNKVRDTVRSQLAALVRKAGPAGVSIAELIDVALEVEEEVWIGIDLTEVSRSLLIS